MRARAAQRTWRDSQDMRLLHPREGSADHGVASWWFGYSTRAAVYSLEMEVETALQCALVTFVRVMMQVVPSELITTLSEPEKASIRCVYDVAEDVPVRVRALLAPVFAPVNPIRVQPSISLLPNSPAQASDRCRSCKSSINPIKSPPSTESTPAFCDCCQRLWPKESTKTKNTMRFCSTCYTENTADRALRLPNINRPEQNRLSKLIEYVAKLKATIEDEMGESGSVDAALPDAHRLSAEQEAATWLTRNKKLRSELQQRLSQPSRGQDEHQLYAKQLEVEHGLFESLTELMQILVETVMQRQLELTPEMRGLVAALRAGAGSIWQEAEADNEELRPVEPTATRRASAKETTPPTDASRKRRESSQRSRSRSRSRDRRRETRGRERRSRSSERRRCRSDRDHSRSRRDDERSEKRPRCFSSSHDHRRESKSTRRT